ncbi:MAG: 16S rRNA (guanine(527)-N(7))-methyltransferase RsmG [Pseudomonadota bacterium]|nr:16S rRNA (guanine(527)-N(7))-methyltransferase RsmG [Pseudomonadota bacterium]
MRTATLEKLLSLGLSQVQCETLEGYLSLVRRWNEACGLVSRGDIERLEERHLLDSMSLLSLLEGRPRLLDIGPGGGFPGMVLAIGRPEMDVVLVERSQKKARFLQQVVYELGITGVEVVAQDVRSYEPENLFGTVTARAVANPIKAWSLAQPFLNRGGRFLLQTTNPISNPLEGSELCETRRGIVGWISVLEVKNRA